MRMLMVLLRGIFGRHGLAKLIVKFQSDHAKSVFIKPCCFHLSHFSQGVYNGRIYTLKIELVKVFSVGIG